MTTLKTSLAIVLSIGSAMLAAWLLGAVCSALYWAAF